jgi:purine nucleosidase
VRFRNCKKKEKTLHSTMPSAKVFIDTDIGSHDDDFLALSYLLNYHADSLVGIATVTSEAQQRANIASLMLADKQLHIPVSAGNEANLYGRKMKQKLRIIMESQDVFPHPGDILPGLLAQQTAKTHYVCLGPSTNLFTLLQNDRTVGEHLAAIHIMAGVYRQTPYYTKAIETNASLDPHAVQNLVNQAPVPVYLYGAEMTGQLTIATALQQELLQHWQNPQIISYARRMAPAKPKVHDLLVVIAALGEPLFAYKAIALDVELCRLDAMGKTRVHASAAASVFIADAIKAGEKKLREIGLESLTHA